MRTPTPAFRFVRIASRLATFALAVLAISSGGRNLRADDPPAPAAPPSPKDPFALSAIEADPTGVATRLSREAERLLVGSQTAPPDPVRAALIWMALVEQDSSVLLAVPRCPWDFAPTGLEEGLYWPAREVALTRLARLPAAGIAAVESRWGSAATRSLEDAATRSGRSGTSIEALAERYPVTTAGSAALLLTADRRMEEGNDAAAVRHLWRWLRLRIAPVEPPERCASVVARLADALVRVEDARGIAVLSRVCTLLPEAVAVVNGVQVAVEDLPARAMAAIRARIAARSGAVRADPPPARPTLLWSLDVTDARLVGGEGASAGLANAAVATDADSVYVVDARRVRRVDRATGLVRWSYPADEALTRDFDPEARSRPFEMPVRDVAACGSLVLAVLGAPPVSETGTFEHEGTLVHGSHLARETRTRIVALDATDGRPVWWSGRIDERDPVVGAPDAAIASPLLVDKDAVSAVVSARRGAVESWLVTFDLATGNVRRTTYLARSESGLVVSKEGAFRTLAAGRIRGLPRAERPVRRGDEIAVVTGTGLAAGVDASSGLLRWVTALPRYTDPRATVDPDADASESAPLGVGAPFSWRNEPQFGYGAWFVAAEDARFAVAIEAGTGRRRWVGSKDRVADPSMDGEISTFPDTSHLVGWMVDEHGRAVVALAGGARALEARDVTSGELVRAMGLESYVEVQPGPSSDSAGRPLRIGSSLRALRGGKLRTLDPVSADPLGPWRERSDRPVSPSNAGTMDGDLVESGDLWLVVGPTRVTALADAATVLALAKATGRDAVDRAARACLTARIQPSRASLSAATAASAAVPMVRAQLLEGAVDALLDSSAGLASIDDSKALASILALVDALDDPARARAYLAVFRGLELRGKDPRLADLDACIVQLLDAWLGFGDRVGVDVDPAGRTRVRSDLYAAKTLPIVAARSASGRLALERREITAAAALLAARDLGESAYVEAIRRAAGTRTAWLSSFDLLAARIDSGRFVDAAATAADLRTSAPFGIDLGSAAAHGLRGLEADLLARAGETIAAREALFDADRDGPALARTLDGGPSSRLAEKLERRSGGPGPGAESGGRLDLFAGGPAPSDGARRELLALEPVGPGATAELDRVFIARGLDLEIRPLPTGAAIPVAAFDTAYLGAVLQDRESAMPGPGVRVASVVAGAAADRGGLRAGDWILRFGGREANDRTSLLREIAETPIGTEVRVDLVRDAKPIELTVAPDRRTGADRTPSRPTRAYLALDGTAIVPSRCGLLRVDLSSGRASPIWRSRHRGDVVESLGFSGTIYVLVGTSPLGDTTVVAVDAVTGGERWAAALDGSTYSPPRVVGSALVVDTVAPARTVLLDKDTGSVRGSYARSAPVEAYSYGPARSREPRASVDSGGCVWLWREGGKRTWLSAIEPASGVASWHHLPAAPAAGGILDIRPLAGGGLVVAASANDTLEIFLPDLRGAVEPFGILRVDGPRFGSQTSGYLDYLSRLAVGGDSVYVARITGGRQATVGAVEIDRRAARGLSVGDPAIWHPPAEPLLRRPPSDPTRGRGDVWPALASVRATLDGVWACATYWDVGFEGAAGRSVWFEPGNHDAFSPIDTKSSVLYTRGPVLVGAWALVPTDGGYVLVERRWLRER